MNQDLEALIKNSQDKAVTVDHAPVQMIQIKVLSDQRIVKVIILVLKALQKRQEDSLVKMKVINLLNLKVMKKTEAQIIQLNRIGRNLR